MKELVPNLIAMTISSLIFMNISVKYRWSEKAWMILSKRIRASFIPTLWISTAALTSAILQSLCESKGMTSISSRIVLVLIWDSILHLCQS